MVASLYFVIATCAAIFGSLSSASPIATYDDLQLSRGAPLQTRDEASSNVNATNHFGIPPDPFVWKYPPTRVVFADYENPSSDFHDFQLLLSNLGDKIRVNLQRARGDLTALWPERHAVCISERFTLLVTPPMGAGHPLTIGYVESVAAALFDWGLAFGRAPIPSISIKVYVAPAPLPVALGSMVIQPEPPSTVAQVETSK